MRSLNGVARRRRESHSASRSFPTIPTAKDGVPLMNPQRTPRRPRLTPKAEKILEALLEHPTHERAAAAAGVSRTTIWRCLKKLKFRRALAEARREIFSQTSARLQQGSSLAANTLLRVMADSTVPASSRVRAAVSVLNFGVQATHLEDFEVRLLDLERSTGRQLRRPSTGLKKAA